MRKTRPHVLVTAGNTREKIDSVRWWSNIFTGQTGLDIARAVQAIADVTLLTSNHEHLRELRATQTDCGITAKYFESHGDLMTLLSGQLENRTFAAVFMTAAVSDYTPDGAYSIISREPANQPDQEVWIVRKVQKPKISSTHQSLALTGKPTAKIIDQFRSHWNYRGLLFKFKLEAGLTESELIAVAQASRVHSQADVIVANTLEMVHGPEPSALIIDQRSTVKVPRARLAEALRNDLARRLAIFPEDNG
jgi:phosphopantothenate-cysteine ligase/phosphopantothenoylcysteine decarboxylase/phosphopantothenate--cysteine ligase